jgi:orotidine-5'-phosphate decarboxylase
MANVYKNIQATINQAASDVDMYTAPDETTSIVKSIKLYNTHSSNLVVDIKVYDLSSTTAFEYDSVTVNTDNSVDLLTFNNVLVLEAGDILRMQTPTTNVVKMTASVLQTSRA